MIYSLSIYTRGLNGFRRVIMTGLFFFAGEIFPTGESSTRMNFCYDLLINCSCSVFTTLKHQNCHVISVGPLNIAFPHLQHHFHNLCSQMHKIKRLAFSHRRRPRINHLYTRYENIDLCLLQIIATSFRPTCYRFTFFVHSISSNHIRLG